MGRFGALGELVDAWHPLLELALRVQVAEPLLHRTALPLGVVVTVEPHDRQLRRRRRHDRRHGALERLRHVDAHVRQLVGLEELERLVPVLVAQPRLVAELDTDAVRLGALCAFDEVVLVRAPDREPRRELEQHRAQLPAPVEGGERVEEARPEVLEGVLVQVLGVDALLALGSHLLRE